MGKILGNRNTTLVLKWEKSLPPHPVLAPVSLNNCHYLDWGFRFRKKTLRIFTEEEVRGELEAAVASLPPPVQGINSTHSLVYEIDSSVLIAQLSHSVRSLIFLQYWFICFEFMLIAHRLQSTI